MEMEIETSYYQQQLEQQDGIVPLRAEKRVEDRFGHDGQEDECGDDQVGGEAVDVGRHGAEAGRIVLHSRQRGQEGGSDHLRHAHDAHFAPLVALRVVA